MKVVLYLRDRIIRFIKQFPLKYLNTIPLYLTKLYGTSNKFKCIGTPSRKINNK